ncbi:MAG: phosphoenolpyruvate--protein phosphotransferase [Elusimicrobiota bacterium]|jgi:phosphotransferase system enzyme I (PtsI)|nr:phosphoenolpyruvate--protein phosphotransferase [Elusimicrobiota bacterium]
MKIIQGKAASKGLAIGKIYLYKKKQDAVKCQYLKQDEVDAELKKLDDSLAKAKEQLKELYDKAVAQVGQKDAQVFEIHQMMLEDEDYLNDIHSMIKDDKFVAEYAAFVTGEKFAKNFAEMDDEYMQGRAADVRDVSSRLINCLMGGEDALIGMEDKFILVADDLNPSETIKLDKSKLLAFVTLQGSVSSHTAILARNLGIPAIVQADEPFDDSIDGKLAIVDGYKGNFYIDPDEVTLAMMNKKKIDEDETKALLLTLKGKEDITLDGHKIEIMANMGSPSEIEMIIDSDAHGVGLFRSEFLYLETHTYPDEETQFNAYRKVLEALKGKKVVIRTMDIGADKQVDYFNLDKEENPALGLRGIRLSFARSDVFKTQLRALFRASAFGILAIMFPMITSPWEIDEAKNFIEEVKDELRKEKHVFDEDVEIGIMIETPAAAVTADVLAKKVDFFSIGTNDLTQYTLAVDRQNQKIDRYVDTHHPAVLRLIANVVVAAHKEGAWVGICGELGSDLTLTKEFLRMGIDELSVSPAKVLEVRRQVRMTKVTKK